MEIERVVKNIYKISEKTHRNKLLPETLLEVLGNSKILFNSNEMQTEIFRKIITSEDQIGAQSELAKKYNIGIQKIGRIKYKMIEKMYLSDAKRRFENLEFDDKFNADVNMLGLDNKTTDLLIELHCEKVKDIYNLDEKYLEEICITRKVNYKKIINRLRILGIERIVRIVRRIQKISKHAYRNELLPETIMEIFSDTNILYDTNETRTHIFREIITAQNNSALEKNIAKKYNVTRQRISQILNKMVEKMYLSDAKRRFEKLKTNNEKLNASINDLGLDNKTTDFLIRLHCEKVKDIYDIEKRYLTSKSDDYKKICGRLELLEIKKPKSNNHLKTIDELCMPPYAYRYIKKSGIYTNQELVRNIDILLENKKIREGIKEKIKELYERIVEELNEIDAEEDFSKKKM